ncbi:MAG: hypothetical protein NT023_17140, partial [Armatimonadetes bacterium]|nr:hypothetical protein [Armatimonadota bacterium]
MGAQVRRDSTRYANRDVVITRKTYWVRLKRLDFRDNLVYLLLRRLYVHQNHHNELLCPLLKSPALYFFVVRYL